ncbi:class I SAM-dependent DNA methyltransferase [Nocardioides sp. Root151]|uniref:HsdM family class I SAM-dependent methyltransferase n=1 Tax=Nocardioides sp. Root151 TaxID=1736475 RepID=UPI0007034AF3|nr:N-6 DNA methylase [Nocardioides sp. Root151]KQZ70635.1 hypothetical protein ASD66_13730 [Nocardioides sp. Root151]
MIRADDSEALRKQRGAFFTPPAIADFLAEWAVLDQPDAKVMDPTCGEAVFLISAGQRFKDLGRDIGDLDEQLYGFDLHQTSLEWAYNLLTEAGMDAHLQQGDFFSIATPDQLGATVPEMDAIIGNPPFVRYQQHIGETRDRSKQAALRQGVRLSNLASSWAALLVHSVGFLKPEGRLAMVLPAELLTVGYAEPVRAWLKQRFEQVHLVMFDRLQFQDATEKVVLVLAAGSGGCDAFSLYYLDDGDDLKKIRVMSNHAATVLDSGKWTDLLLPNRQRHLFRTTSAEHFTSLGTYGSPELGIVTGANKFFTLTETTREEFGLSEKAGQVVKVCPPGTKHLKGLSFSTVSWRELRDAGERVWLFRPDPFDESEAVRKYIAVGKAHGVNEAYKCKIRTPWWRPPTVTAPDLFFTYMSHRYPRLIANTAKTTFVNSMHGLRLRDEAPHFAREALPVLMFNSVTMLGAEIFGRSYGGGILKMEPSEAASLPMPTFEGLANAWDLLKSDARRLDISLRKGQWTNVVKTIDEALLVSTLGISRSDVIELHDAARTLRSRRMGKGSL